MAAVIAALVVGMIAVTAVPVSTARLHAMGGSPVPAKSRVVPAVPTRRGPVFIRPSPLSRPNIISRPVAAAAPVVAAAAPSPPALAGSFHTAYWISAFKPNIPHMPGLSSWLSKLGELLEGECWQNIDATTGQITIKTITRPTTIGSLIIPTTTSVWVRDHGWTFDAKHGKCSVDATNSQLVIPGNILKSTGIFKGAQKVQPMIRVKDPKPSNSDGTYNVNVWDATLPNGEGTVTYYLLADAPTATPLMSHYVIKGKPPVWAQYKFFNAGVNDASNYNPPCSVAPAATVVPHH